MRARAFRILQVCEKQPRVIATKQWKRSINSALTAVIVAAAAFSNARAAAPEVGNGTVPTNPRLRKVYDALVDFRSDDALLSLVPLINEQGRRGLKTEASRLAMARLLALAGFAFYIDENLYSGIQMFSQAHALCPDDLSAKCGLANGLREMPDFEREGKLIEELEKSSEAKKNPLVLITLARHYKRVGEYDKALKYLQEFEKLDVSECDVNSQALYARTLIVEGYGKPAAQKFRAAASRTSNKYMREIFLANAALVEKNEAAQEDHLRRAGSFYPGDPIWCTKLAEWKFSHEKEQEGFDLLQRALLCKRVSGTAYMKMARHLWVNKRYDAAEECMQKYQQRVRTSSESQALLGEIYDARGEAKKCEETYQKVLARDPFQPGSYENLAKHFMFTIKTPHRALAVAANFVKAMPNCWTAHFLKAKVLVKNGNLSGAAQAARAGLKLLAQPASQLNLYASHEAAHAHAIIGAASYADKKFDAALSEAKLFNQMKFNPELPAYLKMIVMRPGKLAFSDQSEYDHVALADMLFEVERFDDCETEYRKALKINSDDHEIRGYLLHVLSQKGDWSAAAKENFAFSQQVVNKIPAKVDEWARGNKSVRETNRRDKVDSNR